MFGRRPEKTGNGLSSVVSLMAYSCQVLQLLHKNVCRKVIELYIAMRNMVVKYGRDGYKSKLYEEDQKSIERGILFEKMRDVEVKWKTLESAGGNRTCVSVQG